MANGIKYTAKAVSYDWGKSKNKGTPFVSVVFEVSEADPKAPGAQFTWEGYFTDATTDRTFKALRLTSTTCLNWRARCMLPWACRPLPTVNWYPLT